MDSPHTDEQADPSTGDLPLEDSRWIPLVTEYKRLAERLASDHLATEDLTKAMADGVIRCMGRETGRRELLSSTLWINDYKLEPGMRGGLAIPARRSGLRLRDWALFGWKPDVDKFWRRYELPPVTDQKLETNAAAIEPPALPARTAPTPAKRLGTLESQYEEALRKHSPKGKRKSEWAAEMEELHGWSTGSVQNWLARPEIDELWRDLGGLATSSKMRGGRRRNG